MLTIDSNGNVSISNAKLKAFLQKHSGVWRVVSSIPGLLLLHRDRSDDSMSASALMSGVVNRRGWLVDVLGFVASARLTGELIVVCKGIQRELFFECGAFRMANSSDRSDLLGEYVVREGIISREQLKQALTVMKQKNMRLGQTLIALGFVSGQDVYGLLNRKLVKIFHDVMAIDDGTYYFVSEIDLSKLPASLYLETDALLMQGMHRLDDLTYYHHTVPRRKPVLDQGGGGDLTLTPLQQQLVAGIDGVSSLSSIDNGLGLGMEKCNATVRDLAAKGLIDLASVTDMEKEAVETIVGGYNRALQMIYRAVSHVGNPADLVASGRQFIAAGPHNNETLKKVVLQDDGTLDHDNITQILRSSGEREVAKLLVMVLTQYISFVLFTANSMLPVDAQPKLTNLVNEAMSPVLSTYL